MEVNLLADRSPGPAFPSGLIDASAGVVIHISSIAHVYVLQFDSRISGRKEPTTYRRGLAKGVAPKGCE